MQAVVTDDDASPCCLGVLLNFVLHVVLVMLRMRACHQENGPPTTIPGFSPVRLRNWACFCFHRVWPRKMARCELTTSTNPQSASASRLATVTLLHAERRPRPVAEVGVLVLHGDWGGEQLRRWDPIQATMPLPTQKLWKRTEERQWLSSVKITTRTPLQI